MHIIRNLFFLLILAFGYNAQGQSFFKISNENDLNIVHEVQRSIVPEKYLVLETNYNDLIHYLTSLRISEEDFKSNKKGIPFGIYNPSGEIEEFIIYETKMMEEGLARKYNNIRTFKGVHKFDSTSKIHLGIGQKGFYATVQNSSASYSIDKYAKDEKEIYTLYYHKDYNSYSEQSQVCGTTSEELLEYDLQNDASFRGDNLPLRTYRIAIATTGEFSEFFGPTTEDVLEELVKSVNRINQILENDLAIRLILIDDNDKIIFLDKDTDPYSDGLSGGTLLGQNTNVVSSNLGFNSYDIGHVYTRGCSDVGGVAFIRSLCQSNKGGGVTCHYSNDITAMAVRVAAHEIGHQLGSNHTFNNCSGNENSGTAFEPGSGSTIMSYGGLCGAVNNVVGTADDYYHISSIIEITNYTRNGGGDNCPTIIATNNHTPDIIIPYEDGFFIPINTPFELTGEATDQDGDQLTYNWEQYNLGPISMLGVPQSNSPSFRSVYPTLNPTRVFPKIETIVSNQVDKNEVLPTYNRDFTFQFVARDNNAESGGVSWDDLDFKADASAGPFLVSYPSLTDTFKVGQEIEIMWDVANTTNENINCQAVDILLSTDGGFTYEHTLLESTNNDGREKVFIPNFITETARIKIKASDNIFFDISNQNFKIEEPDEPGFIIEYSPGYFRNCIPFDVSVNVDTDAFLGFSEEIKLEIKQDLPEGVDYSFGSQSLIPGDNTILDFSFQEGTPSGKIVVEISAATSTDTLYRDIILDLVSSDFSDVKAVNPVSGSSGNNISPRIQWTSDIDATTYTIRFSDNPSFDPAKSEVWYEEEVTDTIFELDDILSKSTVYYWTVVASNECGFETNPTLNTFATEALSCTTFDYNDLPAPISASGVITVNMPIFVNASGQVSDVNVKKLRGTHGWTSELRGEIISPSGTQVLLFDNKCPGQSNFNCGFDDDAVDEITCPLNQGIFYQPQEKLDTFKGEEIGGEWLFVLTDKQIGTGGSIEEYKLELCSNAVLENPFLVKNESLPLPEGLGRRITSEFLLTEDNNNESDELVYTLVSTTNNGILRNNEDTLGIGSQFSQKDINNLSIRYQHDGPEEIDSFIFVVEDGEGGWIDKTTFLINIDNNIVLDVDEIVEKDIKIFPNPNSGEFFIVLDDQLRNVNFELIDNNGRVIQKGTFYYGSDRMIRTQDVMDGIYFLRFYTKDLLVTKKVIILK